MIARFLAAVQFLTTVPVRAATASPGQSALFFPVVGAGLGAVGGLVFQLSLGFVSPAVAASLTLCFWALLTGGLHEDGFADVADAFRAGRPRERILAILKDSRIGAHGALALILVTLVRWQALSAITADPIRSLASIFAVARASMVALAWLAPPAGEGMGFAFSRTLTSRGALAAIVQAIFWGYYSGCGILLLWGATLIVLSTRRYFVHRIGGITGDCLGAACLTAETWGLVLFACRHCM